MDWLSKFAGISTAGIGVFTLAIAIFTAFAAYAAMRAAKTAEKTASAGLAKDILQQYASDRMHSSLIMLRDYLDKYGHEHAVEHFAAPPSAGYFTASKWKREEIDESRREVHWFYKTYFTLYKNKLIQRKVFEVASQTNGYKLFHEVVIPMSKTIQPESEQEPDFSWAQRMKREFPPT